jgi:hypothetical protein
MCSTRWLGPHGRIAAGDPPWQGPKAPAPHWPAEGRPTRRPKAAPPSAEAGGRSPPATPSFDRFAVERPKRGLTNERGPSLETPAPLKPAVDLTTGPRARHDSRPWPPASRTHGAASAACNLSTTPQERGCSGDPARDVSADRRIRAERARGRGPGPAVVPGPGTYSAMEWFGRAGLGEQGEVRLAPSALHRIGGRHRYPEDDGDGGASVPVRAHERFARATFATAPPRGVGNRAACRATGRG